MRSILFPLLLLTFLVTSCQARSNGNTGEPTITAATVTGTPAPTISPAPSETLLPPPAQPTATPIEGMTATQVNVRSDPSTAGTVLGIIPANTKVEITGKDPAGNWWQILYPQGQDGRGWVTSQYVTAANGTAAPVIGGGSDANDGSTAIVQQKINVRSGPGTGFNSLGILNAKDVVHLTGKDSNGAWLQIEFPQGSGPEGKGWVNAAFVQAQGVEQLPIITEAGEAIGTGTPTGVPPTPTATVVPARTDNDSQNNPIASVVFSPLGTNTLIYSGDVSSPEGDPEDWVQFTPYNDTVYASLDCGGRNDLRVTILENGKTSPMVLSCDEKHKPLAVSPGSVYLVRLQAFQFAGGLQYASYTIKIQSSL